VLLTAMTFTAVAGIAAVAGAAAWILWPQPRPQWRRLWVAAVPAGLFALWYVAYSPPEGAKLRPVDDAALVPSYVADGMSHGMRAYTYMTQDWSVALAAALVLLVVWLGMRRGGFDRVLACAVIAAVAYWAIVAVGRGPELRPDQHRYLYPNAAHVALIAVVALGAAGLRSNLRTVITLGVVAIACFVPSAEALRDTFRTERVRSAYARAAITSVEIAGSRVPDGFNPVFPYRPDDGFNGTRYLEAIEQERTLGIPLSEIDGRPEAERKILDESLRGALQLSVRPAPATDGGSCRPLATGEEIPVTVGQPLVVENGGSGEGRLLFRRYADGNSEAGKLPAGEASSLEIPSDRSDKPWRASVAGGGPFRLC
jgi:hypothetical protein